MAPPDRPSEGEIRVSPFYIPATAPVSVHSRRILKNGGSFALLDEFGSAQAAGPGPEGFFVDDTRYLSQLHITINDLRPLLLSSEVSEDNTNLIIDLSNPDLREGGRLCLGGGTVHLKSTIVLAEDALFQVIDLRNFGLVSAEFVLEFNLDADFIDIFELRGSTRPRRGGWIPTVWRPEGPVFAYKGLDGTVRRTRIAFDPPPDPKPVRRSAWHMRLAPGGSGQLRLAAYCEQEGRPPSSSTREGSLKVLRRRIAERRDRATDLNTSNLNFNEWLARSRADLDMLTTETPQGLYAYAGIPWFCTAFGRDGLLTALECLWLDPALARGSLRYLAEHQATALDPDTDAEPGKILHETRRGEMAILGEVPFGRYSGSVDSTPLFVLLAGRYLQRTGDLDLIRRLWPNLLAAIEWMRDYGDRDRDGFLEYDRRSATGLINQGWKDSSDAISHADGSLAEAPIALAEVQAYAYEAYVGSAQMASALGEAAKAEELAAAARRLQQRFEAEFWLEDLGTYALALDGAKRPCRVRASNAGHVLLSGLAAPERAQRVADVLMAPESFSGWGIRTLAEGERRYNPLSYHNGSIWPHDNALIALGFARYGLKQPLIRLLGGLFDTAEWMELRRLPELFCGLPRGPGLGPTAYPVSCSPQAWASATVFALLGALLGISFAPRERQIRFTHPTLPPWLEVLEISNLRLGDSSVDLELRRSREEVGLTVLRRVGDVEICVIS